jgi:murein DD-endopeptidase MepM/ murein hydrolase activator NlpD
VGIGAGTSSLGVETDIETQGNDVTRQPRTQTARAVTATTSERRGWLSHGLAALAISALGLAVAGSLSLTTNAQTTAGEPAAIASNPSIAVSGETNTAATQPGAAASSVGAGSVAGQTAVDGPESASPQPPGTDAFAARDTGVDTSRSEQLRQALAKERAAQRAEQLADTAEQVTRAVRDAASKARARSLDTADRKIQENEVQLAWERQKRAIAARVAARAEAAAQAKAQEARQQAQARTRSSSTAGASATGSTGQISSGGRAVAPVPGAVVGAQFGQYGLWARYHTGLDFRAAYGTPIRAVLPGVVVFAGNTGDWAGNHVAIRHSGGVTTMSSHMSVIAVRAGQSVRAGQVIGYVGQSGRAFGAHLHFELYPAGVQYGDVYKAINPLPWLRAHGLQTH